MPSSLICDTFVENSWRRDLCSNCFRCEAEHEITMIRTANPRQTSNVASPKISAISRDFRSDLHLSLMSSSLTLTGGRSTSQTTSKQNSSTVKSILKGGPDPSKKKGVVFKDEEQVIGFGGLDSVPEDEDDDDDWDASEEDFDEALLDSLDTTEQDKMFTKLTKKNTDFNSINANLVKDNKTQQKGETKLDNSMKLSTTNTEQKRNDRRIDLDLTRSVSEELDKRLQLMQRTKNAPKDEFNYLEVPCKDVLTADDLSLTRDLLIEDAKGDSIDSGAPSSRESSSSPDSFSLKGSERGSSSPDSTRSSKSSAYESIYDAVETSKPQTNHISTVMVNNISVNNEVNGKSNRDNGRNDSSGNTNSVQQAEVTAISICERGPGRQPVRRASHRVVLRTDSDAVIASNNATTIQVEGQPRGIQVKSNAQNKVSSQTLKISEFALGSQGLQPARSDSNLLEGKTALKTVPSSVPSFNAPICRAAVSELHLDRVAQKSNPGNNSRQVKCLSAANIDQSYADQRSAEKYGTLRRTSRLYEDPKYLAFTSKAKPVQPPVVPSIRKDIYGTYRAAKKYTAPKIPAELEQEPIYAEPIEHVAKSQHQSNMEGEKKSAQTENIYQEIRGTSTLSRKERQLAELALELEKARYNSVPNRRSAPVLSEYSGQWDPVARQFQKPMPPGAQAAGSRKTRQAPAIPRAASTGGGSISRAGLFNLKKLLKRGNSGKEEDRKTWKAELQISQPRPMHRPEILHPSDLERLGESVIYQTPRLNSTKVERFGSILHGTSEAQFQPLMAVETAPPPPPMRQRPLRDTETELSRAPSDSVGRQQPKVPKRRLRLDYANMGKSEESDSTTSALQPLAANLWSSSAKLLESLQEINHQELVGLLNHVSTCSHGLPVPENNGSNQGSGTLTSASCNGGISWSDLKLTSERVPKGEDLHICKAVYIPTNAKLTLLFTPPKSLPLSNFLLERTVVASNGLQSGHTVLILPQSQVRTLREFSSHCDERSALYIMLQLCRDLQSLQSQGVATLVPSEQQVLVASWDQLAYLLLMYKKSPKNCSLQQQPLHKFALSILSELQAPEKQDPLLTLVADLLSRNDFDMCKRVIEFELWQAPRDPMANGVPGENAHDAFGRWLALQKALAVQRNCSSQLRHSATGHKQAIPCSVFLEYQLQFLANATPDGLAATLDVIKNVPATPTQQSNASDEADGEELYADYRYC